VKIVEFLQARIAEDQAWAEDNRDDCWAWGDPERTLLECEAKRRIVSAADPEFGMGNYALRALAAIYARHPDYDPDWSLG
jgi:hypothetical protein